MSQASLYINDVELFSFDGIERDIEVTVDRNIIWKDSIGGPPLGVQKYPRTQAVFGVQPKGLDTVRATFTMWLNKTNGALLEQYLPPHHPIDDTEVVNKNNFKITLPATPGESAIPGFGQDDPMLGTGFSTYHSCVLVGGLESLGQKSPGVALWGYRFSLVFPSLGNARTVPGLPFYRLVLSKLFKVHQIQDYSVVHDPFPHADYFTANKITSQGRRYDAALQVQAATYLEMTSIVEWYRTARNQTVQLLASGTLFGPVDPFNSVYKTWNVKVLNLVFRRGQGKTWSGELTLSKVS